MRNIRLVIIALVASFVVIGCQQKKAQADVVSLESNYVVGQTDLVSKLNNDRTALANSSNNIRGVFSGDVQSSGQVKANTIGEENMADDANPRIRTVEGASCSDLVYEGFLSSKTSGTLIGSIPAGTGYPDGVRIKKDSATAKTFTADKWTYVDLNTSGSFVYQEVAIDASAPSISANSLRIERVSTDSTELVDIQDLRTTSCTAGPFEAISDATGEASLEDMFKTGSPVRAGQSQGWVQGAQVSYDTATQFTVKPGSLYINDKYRAVSTDITVPNTADGPATGVSGIDTGAIAASTRYYVYGVADQASLKTYSISFSTNETTPTGITNFRKIGEIVTDANSNFTSGDIVVSHGLSDKEKVTAFVNFQGAGNIARSFNVSSVTNTGVGLNDVNFDIDFVSADYVVTGLAHEDSSASSNEAMTISIQDMQVGSVEINTNQHDGVDRDANVTTLAIFGGQHD